MTKFIVSMKFRHLVGILAFVFGFHYLLYGIPAVLPDTPMYLPESKGDFSLVSFTGDMPRPWVVTYPYAILSSPKVIVGFQYFLSFAASVYLIWIVTRIVAVNQNKKVLFFGALIFVLSSPMYEWNYVLQADGIAMALSLLFLYGAFGVVIDSSKRNFHLSVLCLAGTLVSLIRVFSWISFLPIVLFIVWEIISKKKDSVKLSDYFKVLLFLFSVIVSSIIVSSQQTNMDYARGLQLSQHEDVRGRTMQQLGVISSNPMGNMAVNYILNKHKLNCIEAARVSPDVTWWGEIAHRCTKETQDFSRYFQREYLKFLAERPVGTIRAFKGPYLESFNFSSTYLPDSITSLISSRSASQPTLLLILVVLSVIVFTNRTFMNRTYISLLGLAWSCHAGVLLTVIFSPLDVYRVASTSAAGTFFFTIILICFIISEFADDKYIRKLD